MADLFSLFDEKLQNASLVASPAQSLSDISDDSSEREYVVGKSKSLESVEFKIDYSDFANFVFFNSAEDYFNITGERIINQYPYDGTIDDVRNFLEESDGYQRHVLKNWPKRSGHLRFFQPSGSFIKFEDVGKEDGSAKTSILSPGTGSYTIEAWYKASSSSLATSNTAQFLFQKTTAVGDGISLYLSGSSVFFRVVSGSSTNEIQALCEGDGDRYVAAVLDRGQFTGSLTIITGSSFQFPVVAASASVSLFGPIDLGTASFYIGSGTLSSKTTSLYTGTLGEVRVWKKARQLAEISSSFNSKLYAQQHLVGLWNFNESGSLPNSTLNAIVYDRSGHKLDGHIRNYYAGVRASGALTFGDPDPILFVDAPEVTSLIVEQQTSGSTFDRSNQNIITRFFPENFFIEEERLGTEVLKNFLFVIARMFDNIKMSIDQFPKIYTVNYGEYDQAPDALLADVAKFYGWEFAGNFISSDSLQYFLGKNILSDLNANAALDSKLFEIKNELWRRSLNNLSYIYKTKGTRESVEALLRTYGVRNNLFKIKEYATDSRFGLVPQRISAEKSVNVATFGSSSLTASIYQEISTPYLSGTDHTIEMRVKFPLTSSVGVPATISSGTLWSVAGNQTAYYSLVYSKDSFSSQTGSLFLTSSVGLLAQLTGVGMFDGDWQNVSVAFSNTSGTVEIAVRDTDVFGNVVTRTSSSAAPSIRNLLTSSQLTRTIVGSPKIAFGTSFDTWRFAQYWTQEFRVWKLKLNETELDDHALNFQSYGLRRPRADYDNTLLEHWRLDIDSTASIAAANGAQFFAYDIARAPSLAYITGTNFSENSQVGTKFLNDYSFIASSDLGWTDDKIRIINSSKQRFNDVVNDGSVIALEFNLVDALNEDISQMMASFDELNDILGVGASKYREEYAGLLHLRQQYFRRLQGRLNFRAFSDMLEFFDRSFINMIRRLIPARATFVGDELVVESHSLERPKLQYGKHLPQEKPIDIEATIAVIGPSALRFTSAAGDVSWTQYSTDHPNDTSGISINPTRPTVPNSVKG